MIESKLSIEDVALKFKKHKWNATVTKDGITAIRKYKDGEKRIDIEKRDGGYEITGIKL